MESASDKTAHRWKKALALSSSPSPSLGKTSQSGFSTGGKSGYGGNDDGNNNIGNGNDFHNHDDGLLEAALLPPSLSVTFSNQEERNGNPNDHQDNDNNNDNGLGRNVDHVGGERINIHPWHFFHSHKYSAKNGRHDSNGSDCGERSGNTNGEGGNDMIPEHVPRLPFLGDGRRDYGDDVNRDNFQQLQEELQQQRLQHYQQRTLSRRYFHHHVQGEHSDYDQCQQQQHQQQQQQLETAVDQSSLSPNSARGSLSSVDSVRGTQIPSEQSVGESSSSVTMPSAFNAWPVTTTTRAMTTTISTSSVNDNSGNNAFGQRDYKNDNNNNSNNNNNDNNNVESNANESTTGWSNLSPFIVDLPQPTPTSRTRRKSH